MGEWVEITFTLDQKDPPQVNDDLALAQSEGTHDASGYPISSRPVIEGTITTGDYLGTVIVEFDHDGDDRADGFAAVDAFGQFSYAPDNLPYGENTLTARVVVQSGAQRVEGAWSDTYATPVDFSFFHHSTEPAVISQFEVEDLARAIITGRATVGGFGARVLVEIGIQGDPEPTIKGSVWTNSNGFFRYEIPELAGSAASPVSYNIVARGATADPSGGGHPVKGDESEAITLEYAPEAITPPNLTEFRLAYDTNPSGTATTSLPMFEGTVVNQPSEKGRLGGLVVHFDHDGDGVTDGRALTKPGGSFLYEAIGLTPSTQLQTITAYAVYTDYWGGTHPSATLDLDFILTAAPLVVGLTHEGRWHSSISAHLLSAAARRERNEFRSTGVQEFCLQPAAGCGRLGALACEQTITRRVAPEVHAVASFTNRDRTQVAAGVFAITVNKNTT